MLQAVRAQRWLKQVLSGLVSRKGNAAHQRRRLYLEGLEERTLLNAGALDATFGTGGEVVTPVANSGGVIGLGVQINGDLVALGNSGTNVVLERYSPNGLPDGSFGTAGQVNANLGFIATGLALQGDGKILVAGTKGTLLNNNLQIVVARFLENGTLDTAFGSGGEVTGSTGIESAQITLQRNGKIVVSGITLSMFTTIQALIVERLNADGQTDTTFG